MAVEHDTPEQLPRMHVGGRLAFRRRVSRGQPVADADLPYIPASDDPPPLSSLVPDAVDCVEIEVGPGKGAFMLAATEARPRTFLLGIEAAESYARYAAERLSKTGRKNGLLLADNAKVYLADRVDDAALDRLHIYFSDPWPKRRHRKRRFFTEDMAETFLRVIKPDGHLLCATDNPTYAGQICRVLGAIGGLERDEDEEARLLNLPPGNAFSPTNFERKYVQERRIIRRYAYRRAP